MKKKFKIFAISLLSIIIVLVTFAVIKVQSSVFPEEGEITITGLQKKVYVRRDKYGVPYIEAENDHDLFIATGYISAADRIWQMITMSMAAQGRMSEIAGKEMLDADIFMRSTGLKEKVDEIIENLNPKYKDTLDLFAQGVNKYLENENLPIEFIFTGYKPEKWTAKHCGYVFGVIAMGLSTNLIEELAFLDIAAKIGIAKAAWVFPIYDDEDIPIHEALKLMNLKKEDRKKIETLTFTDGYKNIRNALNQMEKLHPIGLPASNNWALGKSRTQNKFSIFANDTHMPLSMPSIWIMMHLKSPNYDVAGVTVAGIPFIILGLNKNLSWMATMLEADSQDLFLEKIKMINSKPHYLYKDEWIEVKKKKEIFKVRFSDSVEKEIWYTAHGPLIDRALENAHGPHQFPLLPYKPVTKFALAFRWSMNDGDDSAKGIHDMNSAKTPQEFRTALSSLSNIYLNMVYGNKDEIHWQATGKIPLRKKGRGLFPSPGWSGEYDWVGYLDYEMQPRKNNPPEDYIVTANERVVPKDYPVSISASFFAPERADRIRQMIFSKKRHDLYDVFDMQYDQVSLAALKLKKILLQSNVSSELKKLITKQEETYKIIAHSALDIIKNFNGDMNKKSSGAALIGSFYHFATRNIFLDELGPIDSPSWTLFEMINERSYNAIQDHLLVRARSPLFDNIHTKEVETKAEILLTSLIEAYRYCQNKLGINSNNWQWGKLHYIYWIHDLTKNIPLGFYMNRGPFEIGGDFSTVNVSHYPMGSNFRTTAIPAMRLIVDYSREEPAFLINNTGQSGNPASYSYDAMMKPWLAGKNHSLPFKRENVLKQYYKVLSLVPHE